ncbi:MAG: TetR/AcrR family transcriptional regulator [Porticoccaceae bacterium]|nr:TetR/AcrR family transcriptional regulator [Porticoccaceae bacterium]
MKKNFGLEETKKKQPLQLASEPVNIGSSFRKGSGQRWRRTVIRARARKLVAEYGIEGVRIRDLASICGIAQQTLYNNFGGRDQILLASIEELIDFQFEQANREAREEGINPILALCDLTVRLWINDERYVRAIFAVTVMGEGPIAELVRNKGRQFYLDTLHDMSRARQLESWVDIDIMASAISDAVGSAYTKCVTQNFGEQELWRNLAMPVGALLSAMTKGEAAGSIEASLSNLGRNPDS